MKSPNDFEAILFFIEEEMPELFSEFENLTFRSKAAIINSVFDTNFDAKNEAEKMRSRKKRITKRKMIEKRCDQCGKPYHPLIAERDRFCSEECRKNWWGAHRPTLSDAQKDRIREYKAAYRIKNREKIHKKQKRYREENAKNIALSKKAYAKDNPEVAKRNKVRQQAINDDLAEKSKVNGVYQTQWEREEIDFLKNNFKSMSDAKIGEYLERSKRSVEYMRRKLGLKKR